MKIVNPLLATAFIGLHTSKCMITNKFIARSLWPVNGISVTSLLDKSCKCQMIHNQMTSKSIIMEFLHAGFSNVTKCSATHMWYSISLATFSVSVMDVSYYHQYS